MYPVSVEIQKHKFWNNKKCVVTPANRLVFPELFQVLQNFYECFCNTKETWRPCFLFVLENSFTKKKATCLL